MRSWNIIQIALGLAAVSVVSPVTADSTGTEFSGTWDKGRQFFGTAAGVALGTQFFSNQEAHDLAMVQLYFGQVTSGEWAPEQWYGGNWTISGELDLGYQYRGGSAAVAGAAIISRYVFTAEGDWFPYLLAGVGANWTDMGEPDLGGNFQFSPQGGGGVYWFFRPDIAATLEYRFVHYSNGGLRSPNSGVNVNTFLVGISFFR